MIEPEPKGFKFWNNLAQARTRRIVASILKCQNRTGGSLQKEEEPPNTAFNLLCTGVGRLLSLEPVTSRLLSLEPVIIRLLITYQ